jgi:hypothetical protein
MRSLAWCSLVGLLAASPVRAQPTPVPRRTSYKWTAPPAWSARLSLSVGPGWAVCARYGIDGKRRLRDEVARHVGYDPFIPFETFTHPEPNPGVGTDAAQAQAILADNGGQLPVQAGEVIVRLAGTVRSVTGDFKWIGTDPETGQSFGGHNHTISGTDRYACAEILADIGFSIAIRFPGPDFAPLPVCAAEPAPQHATTPPPCPDSRWSIWPTEWPVAPLEKPRPDPTKPAERWPIAARLGFAVWPEVFATGWASLGLTAEIGGRYRAVSLGAEVHVDPSLGSQSLDDVSVSFARVTGAVLLCGHWGWFAGCGVGEAGRILFPNHIATLPPSTFYSAAGVRAGFEFPIAPPRFFLRTSLDLLAPIDPASYAQMGRSLFQVAGPSFGLGLGILTELPL